MTPMTQTPLSPRCDCCSLPISPQSGEDCPRCNYPVNRTKEELFLESSLRDLQRVANHGGANLTIGGLIRRYQMRLNYLRLLKPGVVSPPMMAAPQQAAPSLPPVLPKVQNNDMVWSEYGATGTSLPPVLPEAVPPKIVPAQPAVAQVEKQAEIVLPLKSPPTPPSRLEPPDPPKVPAMSAMPTVAATPVQEPQRPPRRTFSFSWRAFVVDQAITIIGLLGAFLILIGALSSVVTTGDNPPLSFLIVFGVHAFFGIAGVIAYRFANFRLIARIYTGIYTLLVPLAGFTGYSLVQGHQISLTVPTVIAIAAGYAAIVYMLLAVYERFPIYAYLGGMALIVADLAITVDLHLSYWWWPSMLMLLASLALTSIVRSSNSSERFFTGSLVVLRQPVRVLMFTIVGATLLGLVGTTLLSFLVDSFGTFMGVSGGEIRFSILSMTVLLLIWTGGLFWLTKRSRGALVLAFMFLAGVLAFCYAFHFSQGGYALALAGVALLYHGCNRFAARFLQPFGKLGLNLDLIALVLVSVVPLISSIQLAQQLFFAGYTHSPFYQANWDTVAELIAVGVSLLITVGVALLRAKLQGTPGTFAGGRNDWPWLLLLSGFLLNWEYSTIVLALKVTPVWSFVGLMLALVGIAVLVRERFGASWANPLDIVALAEILLTLVLSLVSEADPLSPLLLGFAALTCGVLLYQRRQRWLFLPLTFAVLALPQLISTRPYVALLIGLLLPLVSVAIRRIMANRLHAFDLDIAATPKRAIVWEWPLLAAGLLYGVVVSLLDVSTSASTVSGWFAVTFHVGVAFPVALEMATLALAWYASAALARVKWWLIPVIGFAIAALLLPSDLFWVLVAVAPVAALLAFGVSRRSDRIWASPLYIVALLSAVMVGIAGQHEGQLFAASWILLGFGLFAYVMGVAEDLEPYLWLLPVFATWALIDAALLGDLYRPPITALVFAGAGVAIGLLKLLPMPFLAVNRSNRLQARHLGYALPFYTTAFAAAILTGVYGMLPGARSPFYGAIPDALLIYALTAFGVILFERQPRWLWLVAGFATWGTLLATQVSISYVTGIGLGVGIVGLLLGRLVKQGVVHSALSGLAMSSSMRIKFSWGWPWYLAVLVAAVVVGSWPVLQPNLIGFSEFALLAFAVLAYVTGIGEDSVPLLWFGPLFATWSLINFALHSDANRLLSMALVCAALGVATSCLKFVPRFDRISRALLTYALPFYATAMVAALLMAIDGTYSTTNPLFYVVVVLLYAVIAYAVLLFERQPNWLGIVAGFAVWATLLAIRTNAYTVVAIAIASGVIGMLLGRVLRRPEMQSTFPSFLQVLNRFSWNWPWYGTALVAAVVTGLWPYLPAAQPVAGFIGYSLLAFAALFYLLGIVEEQVPIMWIGSLFATWSLVDSTFQGDFYRLLIVTLVYTALAIVTRCLKFFPRIFGSRQEKTLLRYALPFYATAFIAAVASGCDITLFGIHTFFNGIVPDALPLLVYAAMAFGVVFFERQPRWLGLVAGFGIWGTLLTQRTTIDWVVGIAIGAVLVGLLMGRIIRQPLPNPNAAVSVAGFNLFKFSWGWPWYTVALVAAILTGVLSVSIGAWALLVFALLAYIVGVVEDLPGALWLTPVFAAWSLIGFARLNQFYPFPVVALVGTASGVLMRLRQLPVFASSVPGQQNRRLGYALPLYATAFLAIVLTASFFGLHANNPFYGAVAATMLLYAAVACGVMVFERVPELLVLPAGLAAIAVWLWQPQLNIAPLMIAYSVLCILIFASQFVWKVLPPVTRLKPASLLHNVLGIGGQLLIVLVIIGNNGLSADSGSLAFVGAGALFALAAMVFCYGRIQDIKVMQRVCDYTAGLLVSLVVSWVLAAFQQMNLDLLLLAPATYLIVIAPLLLHDEALPWHQRIGQVIAVLGTALLLLPTLWLSFSNGDGNLLYTVVLMGEALVLLLLGIGVGVRSFVLSGTGLIIVGAIHALFLALIGLSGALTLITTGVTLLAIATGLSIAARRLRSAWAQWD